MKAFKTFTKRFEAPQRNVNIKIYDNFLSLSGIGTGRVKFLLCFFYTFVSVTISFNVMQS